MRLPVVTPTRGRRVASGSGDKERSLLPVVFFKGEFDDLHVVLRFVRFPFVVFDYTLRS